MSAKTIVENTAKELLIGEGSAVMKCLRIIEKLRFDAEFNGQSKEAEVYGKAFEEINEAFDVNDLSYELEMITDKCEKLYEASYDDAIADVMDIFKEKE